MSTWILLRGLTREGRHWGSFPEQLRVEADFSGDAHSITLLDLPGNGRENALSAPLDVAEMVKFVRSRAAGAGLPPPYRLVAMSLGGMVATGWAQRHPEEIERLVLINTSMRPFSAMTERLRPEVWPALMRVAASWANPMKCETIVHDLTCNRVDTQSADIAAWAAIRQSAGVSAANGLRQLWAAARFRAGNHAPACPTLLLSSKADRLVNPVCSTRIAARWGTAHAVHAWAGHDLPHDDPLWTSKAIADWLRNLESLADKPPVVSARRPDPSEPPAALSRNHDCSRFRFAMALYRACEIQVIRHSMRGKTRPITDKIVKRTTRDSLQCSPAHGAGENVLAALIRRVAHIDASYRGQI